MLISYRTDIPKHSTKLDSHPITYTSTPHSSLLVAEPITRCVCRDCRTMQPSSLNSSNAHAATRIQPIGIAMHSPQATPVEPRLFPVAGSTRTPATPMSNPSI